MGGDCPCTGSYTGNSANCEETLRKMPIIGTNTTHNFVNIVLQYIYQFHITSNTSNNSQTTPKRAKTVKKDKTEMHMGGRH